VLGREARTVSAPAEVIVVETDGQVRMPAPG
jgi:hypothetical protein